MPVLFWCLLIGLIPHLVQAVPLTLSWTAPTTSADGTALDDLAGYRVYHAEVGQPYGVPTSVGLVTSATLSGFVEGVRYRFTAVALDTSGNASVEAASVEYTVPHPMDTTPPTIVGGVEDGAVDVAVDAALTVVFSEALDVLSLGSATIVLVDATGEEVPITISYTDATRTLTIEPHAPLDYAAPYTLHLDGLTDTAGNPLPSTEITLTTQPEPPPVPDDPWGCPCSLWALTDVPAVASWADANSVELGVKFRVSVVGKVIGVRYYRGPQNTGTHRARLWTRSGTRLANVQFPVAQESGVGWKTVMFPTPVSIQADRTYLVSYLAPRGGYTVTQHYFLASRTVGPLTALRDGQDGGNGVYRYGSGGFPTQSYQSSHYWVDLIFQPD